MTEWWFFAGVLMLMPIGAFLIDAYFRRKEQFVDKLEAKVKERTSAS